MIRRSRSAAPALFLALALASPAVGGEPPEVRVAAAANLLGTLERLRPAIEEACGCRLSVSGGSSGHLVAQIRMGAPLDLFLSADLERPAALRAEGFGHGDPVVYARGRLELWSPAAGLALGPEWLAATDERLAVADPVSAPYGRAALETLEALGLRERFEDGLVRGRGVGQALQMASSGGARAAFVARSQRLALDGAGSWWSVPDSLHGPVEQGALLLVAAEERPEPARVLDWLLSPAGRAALESAGYEAPPGGDGRP